MSNQISLTIPNDDPIALRAFGNALEEMAVAHGAEVREPVIISQKHAVGDASVETVMQGIAEPLRPSPRTAQALREADDIEAAHSRGFTDDDTLAGDDVELTPAQKIKREMERQGIVPAQPSSDIDADGLPWDARIHSSNQERNADNTWRARRKPKDVTPEQWAEQVAQVRDELFALMAIPVADPAPQCRDCDDTGKFYTMDDTPCACPAGDVYRTETESPAEVFGAPDSVEIPPAPEPLPVVTVADPVPPAPAPLPPEPLPVPPAPAPLPPVAATGAIPTTMAEFMTSLTKYGPKDPSNKDECAAHVARVNEIVARHGLVSVGQLAKRLDLIPQVYADLVKELGV